MLVTFAVIQNILLEDLLSQMTYLQQDHPLALVINFVNILGLTFKNADVPLQGVSVYNGNNIFNKMKMKAITIDEFSQDVKILSTSPHGRDFKLRVPGLRFKAL